MTTKAQEIISAGSRDVTISNPSKVLFPRAGVTKRDLVQYFLTVADGALRGAGGRPNVLVRRPDGVESEADEIVPRARRPVVAGARDGGGRSRGPRRLRSDGVAENVRLARAARLRPPRTAMGIRRRSPRGGRLRARDRAARAGARDEQVVEERAPRRVSRLQPADGLLELAARQMREGLGEAPRVQPSRRRRTDRPASKTRAKS